METKIGKKIVQDVLMNDDLMKIIEENRFPLDELMAYYRCAIMEIETKFNVLNEQFSLYYDRNPIESIKSRMKSEASLINKVKRYGIEFSLPSIEENINDIAGVRVVTSFIEDIYELEKSFLAQDDIVLVQRKDYIANPKPSGYRSLHLIVAVPIFLENEKKMVKVEVQFRTIAMDFWASLEHKIRYKKDIDDENLEAIATKLVQCASESHALDLKMQEIRKEIAIASDEKYHGKGKKVFPFNK